MTTRDKSGERPTRSAADGGAQVDKSGERPTSSAADGGAQVVIDKPWGHELIWAQTDRYVGKLLHVRAGEALSLQFHREKDETIMVLTGKLRFEHFVDGQPPDIHELAPREPFHIPPGMRHRMTAIEDTEIVEVSTPELDDVVRLEDRYGRAPG